MKQFRQFPSPHVHPQSIDSASTPEAFAKREVELGSPALTVTDHGTLGAAYKVFALAKKNNLTPVVGLEGYFRDDNCPILTKHGIPKTDTVPRGSDKEKWAREHPEGSFLDYNKYYHLTLGFRDYPAYLKAVKLISKADARAELHGSERKALFTWEDVEELAATNTTLGSGCLVGMASRHLISNHSNRTQIAKDYFERLHHLFKDRFYIEVFPHVCSHNYVSGVFIDVKKAGKIETLRFYDGKTLRTDAGEGKAEELEKLFREKKATKLLATKDYRVWNDLPEPLEIVAVVMKDGFVQNECSPASPGGDVQWGVNRYMMGMAKRYGIPIQISDDSHFVTSDVKVVQDVRLAQSGWSPFWGSYHRQSSQEAFTYFNAKHGIQEVEFESWIDNGYQWVEGFKGFKFDTTIQLPTKFYPEDTLAHTKRLIDKHGRMPKNNPVYLARLKQELDLFHKNGTVDLLPYFFTCEEVASLYSNQGVLTGPARGSAGGALLSYLLGITSVDPIKYNLSLDRFLTKDRINSGRLPDVDSDFPSRDLLCGMDCATVEVEAEDGTKHVLPDDFKIETDRGLLTVSQAIEQQANFKEWWQAESINKCVDIHHTI